MRDERDVSTPELEGIEPPPDLAKRQAKAKRATVKVRMGYLGPKQRPCCANCAHLVETVHEADTPFQHIRERCGLGTFAVQRGGICGQHRRK